MKRILLLLFLFVSLAASAKTQIGSFAYTLNSSNKTAEVFKSGDGTQYYGSISIPSSVTYSGTTYTVTSIGICAFDGCSGLTSLTIPSTVTSISSFAFDGCSGLTSLTIPSTVTSISSFAFRGCSGLTSITIPSSVTSIGKSAFESCSGLTSIAIPSSVTSIGSSAFYGCNGLTRAEFTSIESLCKMSFGDSFSNPLTNAHHLFIEGKEVTSVIIPSSVTSIGSNTFYGCSGLTSITIPSSVTSIGFNSFGGCSGLTSVTIPNSVTSIDYHAFSECTNLQQVYVSWNDPLQISSYVFNKTPINSATLYVPKGTSSKYATANVWKEFQTITEEMVYPASTKINNINYELYSDLTATVVKGTEAYTGYIIIPETITSGGYTYKVTVIGKEAFRNCQKLYSVSIPNTVVKIEDYAFQGNTYFSNIIIPNSVKTICKNAFESCYYFTDITIPNSVDSLGTSVFQGCSNLKSIKLPEEIKVLSGGMFSKCRSLKSITIPQKVQIIGARAFEECTELSSVSLPSGLREIGYHAFYDCTKLTSVTLPSIISEVGGSAFSNTRLYANEGSLTCLPLWENGYRIYNSTSKSEQLYKPYYKFGQSQTKIGVFMDDNDFYKLSLEKNEWVPQKTFTDLYPATPYSFPIYASKDDSRWYKILETHDIYTESLHFYFNSKETASSIAYSVEEVPGDAVIEDVKLTLWDVKLNMSGGKLRGLVPNSPHTFVINAKIKGGKIYTFEHKLYTKQINFNVKPAKVINVGDVVIASTVNVDENEENIGFEWRRQDWTDIIPSNTGTAYLYAEQMEGIIRNLYTGALWKYRPYYLDNNGGYHYGDWMGFDPTNTSYFEPTVHTYNSLEIKGNTALVKGYALRGTDPIKVQGFVYWKKAAGAKAMDGRMYAAAVPSNAKTVEANGQIMSATLADLDYDSEYAYVAFVTTTEGETFYGEERTFKIEADTSGISDVMSDNASSEPATVMGYYDLNGRRIQNPERGIYIIRYSDGSSRKFMKK